MTIPMRRIEIDEITADELELRASETGVSVAELVARLVHRSDEPYELSEEEIAELDEQWKRIEAGERTYSHEEVSAWLATWGTPDFKPWPHE